MSPAKRGRNARNQSLPKRRHVEPLEERVLLSADFRTIDGTGNNLEHPDWGSAGVELLRLTTVGYEDGVSEPAGANRPSPREISNRVVAQEDSLFNGRSLTDFVWQWGQFLDHDIDLTGTAVPAEPFNIGVPAGDLYFDPAGTGAAVIPMNRSVYAAGTGTDPSNPRQQINQITAYIDASNVYGSDSLRQAELRTFAGGRLKTSAGDLLPFNTAGLPNAGGPDPSLFLAGDVRANEQVALAAMHTLWVREHNRIAAEIAARDFAAADPTLPEIDEEIYQQARRIVGAEMQAITYNEFLPALLGPDALAPYEGYQADVNAGIANVFSTATYRVGHTMLSPEILRLDNQGRAIAAGALALHEAFFASHRLIDEGGIGPVLKGLASQQMQEVDNQLIDAVRNFLFGPPGAGGFDLGSLNIQRGRDHGLPDYNQVRSDFGLEPAASFADITSDRELQAVLASAYGDVNDIDVWVGALAEDHVTGSSVGELLRTVLTDQFERLRDGDRFWYERTFAEEELTEIRNTTLADVIRRNTEMTNLQDNVFLMPMVLDVKPGNSTNRVPLHSNGNVTVALLSTQMAAGEMVDFDARMVDTSDLAALRLGDTMLSEPHRASPRRAVLEDVDGDGDLDLMLHFPMAQLRKSGALNEESTAVVLTFPMESGRLAEGTDIVQMVGQDRARGRAIWVTRHDAFAAWEPAKAPWFSTAHHWLDTLDALRHGPNVPAQPSAASTSDRGWQPHDRLGMSRFGGADDASREVFRALPAEALWEMLAHGMIEAIR